MGNYKVSLEIDIVADSPLHAAKITQSWIRNDNWHYYVQNDESKDIFSVDLNEEDEDAVLPVTDYKSIIE